MQEQHVDLHLQPVKQLRGEVTVPGDKSISHRAVMLGSLAEGTTQIENFLMGADCLSTVACCRALGVDIRQTGPTSLEVKGRGLNGLREPDQVLDTGNSGTTTRLLMGILAGQDFFSVLTGDESIRRRPMGRVVEPLRQMGARINGRRRGTLAPLAISGGNLQPIAYTLPVASAQVKSAVLLAGLFADGITKVSEPVPSRDHTERMLKNFGAELTIEGRQIAVHGRPRLVGQTIVVPGDISSAAFLLVAGCLVPQSELRLLNIGINPTRNGILEVLWQMGADIQVENERETAGEPVADLVVRTSRLRGVTIEGDLIPRLIDEIPVLAVAASLAEGKTVIKDAAELRVKETDRIEAVATELCRLGARVTARPDGLEIEGVEYLTGTVCHTYDDHRMAMALAVAGLVARGQTIVRGSECVNVSFPGFAEKLLNLLQ
ncbi:MAG: 3-phosphoshikimate 1-carboxyvinyltransferase [Firmicutes bacterium]|nr:3-phosphoshikimate 1-carboxyvinyltransferase [Bacillota bacterium]